MTHGHNYNVNNGIDKIVENNVKLFIQCSPHNPAGRVWKEEELSKILEICKKYNVLVISDEIHQDIVMKGYDTKNARGNTDSCVFINITYKTRGIIHINGRKRRLV